MKNEQKAMKSEQEFLTAMWEQINIKEWEEKEIQITYKINKQLIINELLAYGIIIACTIGILIPFLIKDSFAIYTIAVLLLLIAYFVEKSQIGLLSNKIKSQELLNENRNND